MQAFKPIYEPLRFRSVHGASAITCITAQNTVGVTQVVALEPKIVAAQIEAVMGDLAVQAVKTGMLLNLEIIETVAAQIKKWAKTSKRQLLRLKIT